MNKKKLLKKKSKKRRPKFETYMRLFFLFLMVLGLFSLFYLPYTIYKGKQHWHNGNIFAIGKSGYVVEGDEEVLSKGKSFEIDTKKKSGLYGIQAKERMTKLSIYNEKGELVGKTFFDEKRNTVEGIPTLYVTLKKGDYLQATRDIAIQRYVDEAIQKIDDKLTEIQQKEQELVNRADALDVKERKLKELEVELNGTTASSEKEEMTLSEQETEVEVETIHDLPTHEEVFEDDTSNSEEEQDDTEETYNEEI